ncbi:type II secretion system major pseudopilin GspG [Pseudoalteromonas sp. MMG005]|uniref:type II secretion system major pseudopilin GspG n=1 Tax=Pseudoalteromonas sp. MMG005 TaxID=2822682 RepID=UPI001B39D78C|nr:type II secretion system major pseudopilin GspG [Pseudoalteromonas sp. MMG005]MBQ4844341.1 type II secretion system major pseudopilin GspG [Pseudoalteromonas sp. MMG005]
MNNKKNAYGKYHSGFTMMELLIVIVILGLLASLVAPKFFDKLGTAERGVAGTQMVAFETALDTYRLDVGKYPDTLSQLRQDDHVRWDGPYLPKNIPLDPWGNEYSYSKPGNDGNPYTLRSFGADGKVGGTDSNADIVHL